MEIKVYYDDNTLKIRSMVPEDAKIFYDTYLSYNWHPLLETYENYYKEQEAGERLVFIPEYEGKVAGICTLVLKPSEGPLAGKGWPEIVDFGVFFHLHKKGIGNKILDVVEAEAAKYADHVFLAVGVHSGYGAAQRIYVKRGYIPDGSGVWYQGKQLDQYAPCVNDDDLLLFMAKKLKYAEKGRIIFLNGVTSSGKTSIVEALQARRDVFFYVVANDLFQEMVGEQYLEEDYWKHLSEVIIMMYHTAKLYSDMGKNVLIDGILVEREEIRPHYQQLMEIMKDSPLDIVEVYCPLEICRQRNIERGDRYESQSEEQEQLMSKDIGYRMRVDTSKYSAEECAEQIIKTLCSQN